MHYVLQIISGSQLLTIYTCVYMCVHTRVHTLILSTFSLPSHLCYNNP